MRAERTRANLPTIRAFRARRARAPSTKGMRAAALNFNRRRRGSRIFFGFFLRAVTKKCKFSLNFETIV